MEFGVQFFPAVGPDQKPADQYWREALELTQLAEGLGFTNVHTGEHSFLSYGGHSPRPSLLPCPRAGADALDASDPRRGAAGIQQPAEACGPDRDGGCDFRRP